MNISIQHSERREESRSMRKNRGFSLTEMLVVIAIILILGALIFPSLQRTREMAMRVACLSNLRQIGMVDKLYSGENSGRLMLRNSGHGQSVSHLADGSNFFAPGFVITQLAPADTWFCPMFYMSRGWGVPKPPGTRLTRGDRAAMAQWNYTGYNWYRAAWEDKMTGNGFEVCQGWPFDGIWGMLPNGQMGALNFGGVTGWEIREQDLKPGAVRIGEFYAAIENHDSNDSWITGWWHRGVDGRPEGGNILLTDLSAQWSRSLSRMPNVLAWATPAQ